MTESVWYGREAGFGGFTGQGLGDVVVVITPLFSAAPNWARATGAAYTEATRRF
jgi:hypothetical protein